MCWLLLLCFFLQTERTSSLLRELPAELAALTRLLSVGSPFRVARSRVSCFVAPREKYNKFGGGGVRPLARGRCRLLSPRRLLCVTVRFDPFWRSLEVFVDNRSFFGLRVGFRGSRSEV